MFREKLWEPRARKCMEKLDSIDSASFDISVARHMLEGARYEIAEEFLITGMNEIERAIKDGFLAPEEGYNMIRTIEDKVFPYTLKKETTQEVMKTIVDLQFQLAEKLYIAVWKCMRLF